MWMNSGEPTGVSNVFTPLGLQTSSPRSATSGGHYPVLPCFAFVQLYSGHTVQMNLEQIVDRSRSRGAGDDVDVIQGSEQELSSCIWPFFFERASVATRTTCPTQSTSARVDNTSFTNCFANVLASKRRNTVPVAMPRTPPSFFLKPVVWANKKERKMVSGTVARANSCPATMSNNNVSLSSRQTCKFSFVHPPGLRHCPKVHFGDRRQTTWNPTPTGRQVRNW